MLDETDYDQLKSEFNAYIYATRDLALQPEKVALGGLVSLIAMHHLTPPIIDRHTQDFASQLHSAVDRFITLYLNLPEDYKYTYSVPFDHPALYQLIMTTERMSLTNDEHLLRLMDEAPLTFDVNINGATPTSIADLMINLLKPQPNATIFDPAARTGEFYSSARQHIAAPFSFTAAEIHLSNLLTLKLKSYLSAQSQLKNISDYIFDVASTLPEFDYVVSNPPVGKLSQLEAHYKFRDALKGNATKDMSLNYIELGLQHLKTQGKAAFLVPLGILFSNGEAEKKREFWVVSGLLKSVIILPARTLPHTSLKCAILLFERDEKRTFIRLINAEDCIEPGGKTRGAQTQINQRMICERMESKSNKNGATDVTAARLSKFNYRLIPDQYIEHIQGDRNAVSERWEKIGNLAEIIQGSSLSKVQKGSVPVIRGQDLRTHKIDKANLFNRDLSSLSRPAVTCTTNDILLQRIGKNPAAYLVSEDEAGLAVENTVFILRFNTLSREHISFICDFLNSDQVSDRLSNTRSYSVIATHTKKSIGSLEVPVPDQKSLVMANGLNNLERQLQQELDKAKKYKAALFSGNGKTEVADIIDGAIFTAKSLTFALKSKDDISIRVRNHYPFPIAYAYRNIYQERETAGIYERQMKFGEQLLSFLSAVGLSLVTRYASQRNSDAISSLMAQYQEDLKKGMSPGHYQSLLKNCCAQLIVNEHNEIDQEFSRIWYRANNMKESDFAKNSQELLVRKLNDFKHHRGPANRYERSRGCKEQSTAINTVLELIEVCSKWKLLRIDDINKGWSSDKFEYSSSLMQGDHPAFEQELFESEVKLSKDKLYIKYGHEFICLYPLLSIVYNEATRKEEVFSIDKQTKKGLSLKSFESGTSIESAEVTKDFEYWIKNLT